MNWLPWAFPALPRKVVWPWHWDLVKLQCLWKFTNMKAATTAFGGLSEWLKSPAHARSPPGTCVSSSCHCDPGAVEPRGVCRPIFFKCFLSMIAFLPVFLARWGHYLGRPFTRVCICCFSGQKLFAIMILSNPLTLGGGATAGLECILIWAMCFRLWLASCLLYRISYSCKDRSPVWGSNDQSGMFPSRPWFFSFFFLIKFTF